MNRNLLLKVETIQVFKINIIETDLIIKCQYEVFHLYIRQRDHKCSNLNMKRGRILYILIKIFISLQSLNIQEEIPDKTLLKR